MDIGLNWELLDKPLIWKNLFSNDNPVDCEVGFGNGEFLIHKAMEYSDRNYLGIDYSKKYYKKAIKTVEKAHINNIRLVWIEAKAAFLILVPDKSLSHLYINFPDPWPKEKHVKNRLLDKEFFNIAATRVKNGGEVIIVTDDPFYRDFILEEVESTHLWDSLFHKGYTDELSNYYRTKYERKWRSLNKGIYYMVFQKKRNPDLKYSIDKYEIDDVALNDFNPSLLHKIKGKVILKDNSVVKLLGYTIKEEGIQLDVLLKDGSLFRKQALFLSESEDNNWILRIPDYVFSGCSVKTFTDTLKGLNK